MIVGGLAPIRGDCILGATEGAEPTVNDTVVDRWVTRLALCVPGGVPWNAANPPYNRCFMTQ